MAEKKMSKKKITFVYKYAPDYCPQFISGIWGGVNPTGLIEAHFYSDHIPLPETSTHLLEDGKLDGKAVSRTPEPPIGPTRIIKQGILMDLEMAKSFNQWLSDKIKELEGIIAKSK